MPLLKRHDAPMRPMCHWGSHALKSLNDNRDPGIDLLVREAVQNSADASVDGAFVDIDFEYKKFDCSKLAGILDDPALKRLKKLNGGSWTGVALEIRDKGTKGLGGPSCLSKVPRLKDGSFSQNELGNFIRLTQCIGQAQTKDGSGGSFGVGKTVFYRVSMAPVLFYSRFKRLDGKFIERLIFCFFEDQEVKAEDDSKDPKPQSLLLNDTGFAWWCDDVTDADEALPLEDSRKINKILSQLGVKPFTGKETGTSIFLPMLKPGGLPSPPMPETPGSEARFPDWLSSKDNVENHAEYTRVAVQRWYAPRLYNERYDKGPVLRVRVNGRAVRQTLPLFSLMRDLYNFANTGDKTGAPQNAQFLTFRINSTLENPSEPPASIAVARLPKDHAFLVGDDGLSPSPEIQLHNFDLHGAGATPMLALVRKPGMIVSYVREGAWVRGIPEDRNHYTVGILVLNGAAKMRSQFTPAGKSATNLEEYVRGNEPAAHNEWSEDKNIGSFQPDVFGAMQRGASAAIKKALFGDDTSAEASSKLSALAAKIAGLLLPAGFGKAVRRTTALKGGGKSGGAGQRKKGSGLSLDIENVEHLKDGVALSFTIHTGIASSKNAAKGSKAFSLQLCAATESGRVTGETWRTETGQPFPFELRRLSVGSSEGKGRKSELGIKLNKCGSVKERTLAVALNKESVVFNSSKLGEIISGSVEIRVADTAFMPSISLHEGEVG
jgi:hypothetical protein